MKVMILPHVTIIGVYRSPAVPVLQYDNCQFNIFIGNFNINWLDESNRRPLLIVIITGN